MVSLLRGRSGTPLLAILAACLLIASPAVATDGAKIDLSATTCADLAGGSTVARRFYVIWFDGYLAAKHGTSVSNADLMQQRLDAVLKACESDASQKVLPLMEKQK